MAQSDSLPKGAESSPEILLPYVWKIHDYLNDLIRFADTKASVVLALALGILSALFGAKIQHNFTSRWSTAAGPDFGEILLGLLSFAALAFLVAAIGMAVTAILPRMSKKATTSLVFWQGILQHGSHGDYLAQLLPQNPSQLMQHLAEGIFNLSGVCRKKYFHVRWSICLGGLGGALGALAIMFSS